MASTTDLSGTVDNILEDAIMKLQKIESDNTLNLENAYSKLGQITNIIKSLEKRKVQRMLDYIERVYLNIKQSKDDAFFNIITAISNENYTNSSLTTIPDLVSNASACGFWPLYENYNNLIDRIDAEYFNHDNHARRVFLSDAFIQDIENGVDKIIVLVRLTAIANKRDDFVRFVNQSATLASFDASPDKRFYNGLLHMISSNLRSYISYVLTNEISLQPHEKEDLAMANGFGGFTNVFSLFPPFNKCMGFVTADIQEQLIYRSFMSGVIPASQLPTKFEKIREIHAKWYSNILINRFKSRIDIRKSKILQNQRKCLCRERKSPSANPNVEKQLAFVKKELIYNDCINDFSKLFGIGQED